MPHLGSSNEPLYVFVIYRVRVRKYVSTKFQKNYLTIIINIPKSADHVIHIKCEIQQNK